MAVKYILTISQWLVCLLKHIKVKMVKDFYFCSIITNFIVGEKIQHAYLSKTCTDNNLLWYIIHHNIFKNEVL